MAMEKFEPGESDRMRQFMGPGAGDQHLRQAIHFCWMTLPDSQKTLDGLEQEVRRLVDRIFRDMREDEARTAKG